MGRAAATITSKLVSATHSVKLPGRRPGHPVPFREGQSAAVPYASTYVSHSSNIVVGAVKKFLTFLF